MVSLCEGYAYEQVAEKERQKNRGAEAPHFTEATEAISV